MDKLTQKFFHQVQELQSQLENLLDKDWGPRPPQALQSPTPFELQTDLAQLETLGWSLPRTEPERSQVLFDRLCPYFQTGFCFHAAPGTPAPNWALWRLESAFHLGQIYPLLPEDRERVISLPQMTLLEVRKLKPSFLLNEVKLPLELANQETTAIVIRPADTRVWIFFSELGDVFLKPHLSLIQEKCLTLLADFLGDET